MRDDQRNPNKVGDRALLRLGPPGWAWEWMRRTAEYSHAFAKTPPVRRHILRPHPRFMTIESDGPASENSSGLLFLEDPRYFYAEAAVFWRTRFDPAILPVTALGVQSSDPLAVDLRYLAIATTVLKFTDAREHVLLYDGVRSIQLEVTHGSVLEGPVRLSHDVRGLESVRFARLMTVERLAALQEIGRLPMKLFPPLPEAERWLRWLKALDLARADRSYPEIARRIYGEELVEEALATGLTKWPLSRVERLLENADKMLQGGYRRIFDQNRRRRRNS